MNAGMQGENGKPRGVLSEPAFNLLMWMKAMRSVVEPGEPVGVLAAQSVGEPSTQVRNDGCYCCEPRVCRRVVAADACGM